jgi:peptidoglycan hydrolase CwlO-like protein
LLTSREKGAMSNWSPPPASLPAWAQKQDDDDQKLKDVKQLLSVTTERMLDMHSKFLAKKRYSEELERDVTDMKKDIEKLQEDVKKRDNDIDAQKKYIETLHELIPKQ